MRARYMWVALPLCLVVLLLALPNPQSPQIHASAVQAQSVPASFGAATVTPLPASDLAVTINITREEYESALAKWRALTVQEYEITLLDSSRMASPGKLKLHIKPEGGEPSIISYTDLTGEQPKTIPLGILDTGELDYLRGLSVERMFRLLGGLFTQELATTSSAYLEYDVAFDPVLGYPSHVYSRAFPHKGGLPVTECCISYEVTSVRIIKNATPGMPRSGNPGSDVSTNVSRAQFEEATAKWLARGVQEYEIVVENITMYLDGNWKLHVVISDEKPRVTDIHQVGDDGTEIPPPHELTPDDVKYLTSLTVEEGFAFVQSVLDNKLSSDPDNSWVYDITFDEGLGYVSELKGQGFPKNGDHVTDLYYGMKVKSVKILKSLMPGMPKSANPGP